MKKQRHCRAKAIWYCKVLVLQCYWSIGFIFLCCCCRAQSLNLAQVETLLVEIDSLNYVGAFEIGLEKIKTVEPFLEENEAWESLYQSYVLKYKFLTNIRKNKRARRAIKKAKNIWESHFGNLTPELLSF